MDGDERVWLVVFSLGSTRFGLFAENVDQVVAISALTEPPDRPPWLLGSLVLSGESVPVIDVVGLLRLSVPGPDLDARIIIARRNGERIGLLVRSDVQILEVPTAGIRPPGAVEARQEGLEAIARTADGPVFVIGLDGIEALENEPAAVP